MSRRINRTLPLKSIGRLIEWGESVKKALTSGNFEKVVNQYAEVLDNEFKSIINKENNKYAESHEHINSILPSCYFKTEQNDKTNWTITIGNNSPKFKYFEYGTGKTGNTYKNNYQDNPESKGWQYMSGKYIIRSMGGNKYWTVKMYPDGHKEVLPDARGGWKFTYGSQKMFTFGQPGAFSLTQVKRKANVKPKMNQVKKSIMEVIPNITKK